MSTYTRCIAIIGSLWDLLWNRDHATGTNRLGAQEISVALDDDGVPGIYLAHERIAGIAKDHGTVANEAAMLGLHSAGADALETLYPRYVSPGDSCARADDPGWRWYCLSGHGTVLSDWERRPLAGALNSKQDTLDNAATLADLSDANGALLYRGEAIGGSGGGETSLLTALMTDSPYACWPMTEASGDLVDIVAGRDLTVSGSGTLTRQYSPLSDETPVAHWSGSLLASRADTLGITTPWAGSWTVTAAVTLLESPQGNGFVVLGIRGYDETEAANGQLFCWITPSRTVYVAWEYGAGVDVGITTSIALDVGRAYLVAARKDASTRTLQVLIDGRVVAMRSYTSEPTGGGTVITHVGQYSPAYPSVAPTLLGPVALYTSALPLTRLRAHARAARLG